MNKNAKTEKIRQLNDQLRQTFAGGQIVVTRGIASLSELDRAAVLKAVSEFSKFDEDCDPYQQHDCGAVEVARQTVFWKIDYYDLDMQFLSPDPSDPEVTKRVLTIMLASEY